jgi:hypothetical protein
MQLWAVDIVDGVMKVEGLRGGAVDEGGLRRR